MQISAVHLDLLTVADSVALWAQPSVFLQVVQSPQFILSTCGLLLVFAYTSVMRLS